MKRDVDRLPEPGTGIVAFGCMFVLVVVAGVPMLLGSSWRVWIVLGIIAFVVALIAARHGDTFFAKVLHWLPWWP